MQRILRTLLPITMLLAALAVTACGGDKVSGSTDVDTLLQETFSGKKEIKSGKFELALKVNISGGAAPVQGPITAKLSGPFETEGPTKLPKFGLQAVFEGAGQSIKAGATSTGEKAFVNFMGQDYAVSDQVYEQFRKTYEQSAKQGNAQENQSLQSLGLDPRRWLTNARNAGETKVGDTETVQITGDVDVPKLLDDLDAALKKASALGLPSQGQLPTTLTDEQKAQVAKAVEGLKVNIYTGKEDTILRRMQIAFKVSDPTGGGQGSADIDFDLSLLDLNEGQEFSEPENPKPFEELVGSLGNLGLGGLGGLGGAGAGGSGSSGSSGGSGSGSSESGSANSSENVEKYTQCVEDAGNDLEKAQKCAELLTK